MFTFWVICSVVCCAFVTVICTGDIGPGMWHVIHINKCDQALHKFKFDVSQQKINRTHDGFNADLLLEEDFSEDYGIRVDICKEVDGGCKQYQVLSDDNFVNFVNKYAENNVKACLELVGVDPPNFPVAKGEYHLKDYVFDYSELPEDATYGTFCAKAFILQDTQEVGCVEMHLEFKEQEDDDDCDCDD